MKQEIKEQWVAALRSGEYEQGKNTLSSDGKFCCLGVLCELAWIAGGIVTKDSTFTQVSYDDQWCTLPYSVQQWARLYETNPEVAVDDGVYPLAMLNDAGDGDHDETWLESFSFAQIADLIEAQL